MTPRELLAWNIRKLRVERGLSQERLALEAQVERVSISQIERKQVNLGIDSLGKIAQALNCAVSDLLMMPPPGDKMPPVLRPGRKNSN
ncbi:helix-turn-helix domain-containing protein [Rhizobium rhizophilum]|uniref:Helix-turn-helix transcriptional regulator n=1 Tax=Rhizobium rhizophilum TaxID=1850373 RepID=A0ABY2QS11_9HYPH|nr:helix-turn-helix transcriptional regulator [Rhizobium rhizophilum]THV12399.1 helix-turn-helix transcriptional regulator [Rhizobium rhizophilum]